MNTVDLIICVVLFNVVVSQESFKTAKVAYKLRVRETLSTSSFGPEGLDAATVDFIVRNWDLNYPQSCASVGKNSTLTCSMQYLRKFVKGSISESGYLCI